MRCARLLWIRDNESTVTFAAFPATAADIAPTDKE
jgi:hypothetical protein